MIFTLPQIDIFPAASFQSTFRSCCLSLSELPLPGLVSNSNWYSKI